MRVLRALIPFILTVAIVYLLDHPIGILPALGKLLDPTSGCWANAEPVDKDFNNHIKLTELKQPVSIWLDERMVAHIHAENDQDLYYAQGYVHAYFRLFQMDLQTRAAAGRVSEIIGDKALKFDRGQRRKGMVYAAENSLKAIEADKHTKVMMDAYTAGINNYIASLNYKDFPLEYKIIGFDPEPWTNLKSALLLKYMADDLTGATDDIPLTYLRDMLPPAEFDLLFPEKISGSTPVIPAGTLFGCPSLKRPPVPGDSNIWGHFTAADFEQKKVEGKGSNNWAISGDRTKSGAPILCNDPHLGLNLPSLWYEIQLQTPDMNVYGVSLPGAPGVVIGFNDSLSWGLTNNYRDVKDFYTITPVQGDNSKYMFDGKETLYTNRIERIKLKGKEDFVDTVKYTIQGPVMYDETFHGPNELKKPLAVCWMAHKSTNELLAIYMLNRAKNYLEFVDAILNFKCPAQNFVYADREDNIAMWGQGQFVNKWKDQGRFIMNGETSKTLWGDLIPMRENPHVLDPLQGYVSSANQSVTDDTYPYWYNGDFVERRAWRINQLLNNMHSATVEDMFGMQNDNYSILASQLLPVILKYLPASPNKHDSNYVDSLKKWNYYLNAESTTATIYQVWWYYFNRDKWSRFRNVPDYLLPLQETTIQLVRHTDSLTMGSKPDTSGVPELRSVVAKSWNEAIDSLSKLEKKNKMQWYKAKSTSVTHLAKIPAFSFKDLKIGGWGNTINAANPDHGPSWRMVVQMGKEIDAYGVYPGGQSGNPGSKYYATFLDSWAAGKYYHLTFLPNKPDQDKKLIKYTWTLEP